MPKDWAEQVAEAISNEVLIDSERVPEVIDTMAMLIRSKAREALGAGGAGWADAIAAEWCDGLDEDGAHLAALIRTKAREAGTMAWEAYEAAAGRPSGIRYYKEEAEQLAHELDHDEGYPTHTVHPVLVLRMEEEDGT